MTEGEAFQVWRWARQRQAAKSPQARSRRISRSKSDITIHYEGILGEYAVAKLFCLPYDPRPLPGGDMHQPDLVLPNGLTANVKYRGRRGWDFALAGTDPDEFTADIGVLCWPASDDPLCDDVDVVGWIWRDEFSKLAEIENYVKRDGGDRLVVKPDALRPLAELLKLVYLEAA